MNAFKNWISDHSLMICRVALGVGVFGIATVGLHAFTGIAWVGSMILAIIAIAAIVATLMIRHITMTNTTGTTEQVTKPEPARPLNLDDTDEIPVVRSLSIVPEPEGSGLVQVSTGEHYHSPLWEWGAAGLITLVLEVTWFGLAKPAQHFTIIYLIVALGLLLVPAWWLMMVKKEYARRRPSAAQLAIPYRPELMLLSEHDLQGIMSKLTVSERSTNSDQEIWVATRKVRVEPILRSVLLGMLLVVMAGLTLNLSLKGGTSGTLSLVTMLFAAILALWIVAIWVQWYSWYFVQTDKRVMVIIQWPAWLFLMDGRKPALIAKNLQWSESKDQLNLLSKLMHQPWGTVDVDSITEHDEDFHNMKFMPRNGEIADTINELIVSASQSSV